MFLAEPSPTQGDVHFDLLNIPVRINPWFWVTTIFLGLGGSPDPVFIAIWVVAVLLCILLHELGHAVVMLATRLPAVDRAVFLWRHAIPRSSRYGVRRPGPWGDMLIAFAGPLSGFILAAVLALGFRYVGGQPVYVFEPSWRDVVPIVVLRNPYAMHFFYDIFYITVWWGLVNLLPIYPLDGGLIAQQVFHLTNPQDAIRPSLVLSVVVGGLMAVIALVHWQSTKEWGDIYIVLFFAWLSYSNFQMLQAYGGGWR